jgi:hypothetical protein
MNIFEHEINDGLESIVKASASVCYASVAEPSELINKRNIKLSESKIHKINAFFKK